MWISTLLYTIIYYSLIFRDNIMQYIFDFFPAGTIFLTILFQLILVGILDKYKPVNRSRTKHLLIVWSFTLCSILFTACFARIVANWTWDDFTIYDEIGRHEHGMAFSAILYPFIPVSIMMLYWSLLCEWGTKKVQINLGLLYYVWLSWVFIYLAFIK